MRTGLDAIGSADGSTNTLLFAEKNGRAIPQALWSVMPSAITPPAWNATAWQQLPVFGMLVNPAPFPIQGLVVNGGSEYAPSSNHPGGVVVTFCDGHTIFLRDSVAAHVYAQLCTSDSRWSSSMSVYTTNSGSNAGTTLVNGWLRNTFTGAPPYTLSEGDY